MHAHTLRLLEDYLKPGIKVLDVGSGSGYLTLCLAKMIGSGSVFGLDHIEELINIAIENINNSNPELVNGENISIRMVHGDGRNGLPEFAPFDVIHVGASTPEIPKALINQLAFGGVIIAPVGQISSVQHITVGRKKMDGSMDYANCFNVCYAPLTDREKQCPGS
jgi:protein-L-isoaspartate(D-aspartate) O-methyltransferase